MSDEPQGPAGRHGFGQPGHKEQHHAERVAKRRAKDRAYEEKEALKHPNDENVYHGHHVVHEADLNSVFEGDEEELTRVRFRHRLVHSITLSFLGLILLVAVIVAILISTGAINLPFGNSFAANAPTCPAATMTYPANKNVSVNVYNSTRVDGLASGVAAQLKKRGYVVISVGTQHTDGTGTAVVVSGPAGQAAAFNLQRNIAGSEYMADTRKDGSVDVYLTRTFTDLVAANKVVKKPGLLACPEYSPTPTAAAKSTVPAKATVAANPKK